MIDIDVVDGIGTDATTVQDRSFFPHALPVANLSDLVLRLTARVGLTHDLRRLRVIGHGGRARRGSGTRATGRTSSTLRPPSA